MLDTLFCCFRSKKQVHEIYTCAPSDVTTQVQSYINAGGPLNKLANDYLILAKKGTQYEHLSRFFKAIETKEKYNSDLNQKKVSLVFTIYYWIVRFFAKRDLEASQKTCLSIVDSIKKDTNLAAEIVRGACRAGDASFIRRLSQQGVPIENSRHLYAEAIQGGSLDVVQALNEMQVPFSSREFSRLFETPNTDAIFNYVLQEMDYDHWDFTHESLLEAAVACSKKDKVKALTARYTVRYAGPDYPSTALIEAIRVYSRSGSDETKKAEALEIIRMLLDLNELNPDETDNNHCPPLYYVVTEGDEIVLALLFKRTTALNFQDSDSADLFQLALLRKVPNKAVLTLLLNRNPNWLERTPFYLIEALRSENFEAATALIEVIEGLKKPSNAQLFTQCLIEIAKSKFNQQEVSEMTQSLIRLGADMTFLDKSKSCALTYALTSENQELVRVMLKARPELVQYALMYASKKMVEFLTKEFDANLNKALSKELSLPKIDEVIVTKFLNNGADIFAIVDEFTILESVFQKCLKKDSQSIEVFKLFLFHMKETMAEVFPGIQSTLIKRAEHHPTLVEMIKKPTKTRFS